MPRWYAVSAVLALAGTSHGFIVNQFQIPAGGMIAPTVGGFVDYYGERPLLGDLVIDDSRGFWKSYGDFLLSLSWVAADPRGGGVDVDGYNNSFSRLLPGPGADPTVPLFGSHNSNVFVGYPGGLDPQGLAFLGGPIGATWGPGSGANFQMSSEVSPVNGVSIDSVFWGYFTMKDPSAVITGSDLVVRIGGIDRMLPLDGSVGPLSGGYSIAYEEHMVSAEWFEYQEYKAVKAFVVAPAPCAIGLAGIAGLASLPRRRKR